MTPGCLSIKVHIDYQTFAISGCMLYCNFCYIELIFRHNFEFNIFVFIFNFFFPLIILILVCIYTSFTMFIYKFSRHILGNLSPV